MDYFDRYVSNTLAGGGNQSYFESDGKPMTGRQIYRIFSGGTYEYSFLFSNISDSVIGDHVPNHVCDEYRIHRLRVGIFPRGVDVTDPSLALFDVLFDGKREKTVAPGEFFHSDGIRLSANAGDELCLEITFSGREIPYLEETNIRTVLLHDGVFGPGKTMPYPGMIGCDRKVRQRVVFLGDSITEGLGTPMDSYAGYAQQTAAMLGDAYAFWDIGIGYGRASNAATDGAWLYKAKQGDLVSVCLGVNDLLYDCPEETIKADLKTVVDKLNRAGCRVGILTVPPFDWSPERTPIWKRINRYITEELGKETVFVFDTVPYWGCGGEKEHVSRYNAHPNEEGCNVFAAAFSGFLTDNHIL